MMKLLKKNQLKIKKINLRKKPPLKKMVKKEKNHLKRAKNQTMGMKIHSHKTLSIDQCVLIHFIIPFLTEINWKKVTTKVIQTVSWSDFVKSSFLFNTPNITYFFIFNSVNRYKNNYWVDSVVV